MNIRCWQFPIVGDSHKLDISNDYFFPQNGKQGWPKPTNPWGPCWAKNWEKAVELGAHPPTPLFCMQ